MSSDRPRLLRVLMLAGALLAATGPTAQAAIDFSRTDLVGTSSATSLALGDLDGKDGPDLVSIGASGQLEVRRSQGDGTFSAPTLPTVAGCAPFQVLLADVYGGFNGLAGDGKLDALISCFSGSFGRLPGDGAGGFGTFEVADSLGTSGFVLAGEDRIALAEWRESGPPVVIFPFAGYDSGVNFQKFCWSYDYVKHDCNQTGSKSDPMNLGRGPIVAADVDAGDFDEVLTTGQYGNTLSTFGIDTGAVTNPRVQDFGSLPPGFGTQRDIAVGDLQPDGLPDVITMAGNGEGGFANVILGEGLTGGPAPNRLALTFTAYASAKYLYRGDIFDADADGRPDFVGTLTTGSVIVQRSNGAGGLGSPEVVATAGFGANVNAESFSSVAGDLDGNGYTDLVVGGGRANPVQVLLNQPAVKAPGPGGTPTPAPGGGAGTPTPTPVPGSATPTPVPGTPGTPGGTGTPGTPTTPGGPGPGGTPQSQTAKLVISKLRVKGRTFSVEVNLPATVRLRVQRCKTVETAGKKRTTCRTVSKLSGTAATAGRISVVAPAKLGAGNYLVTATAVGATKVATTLRLPRR